jgi:hypothetical protein
MDSAIQFNAEFQLVAVKVNEKTFDHMLPPEFQVEELFISKGFPDFLFGRRRTLSELPGEYFFLLFQGFCGFLKK